MVDVVATSITGNLDSFTYRITFPDPQFTLVSNTFAAPFDNTLAPAGNNGSVPWSGLPRLITDIADAGSPGFTSLVPDLYRTTATTTGAGVVGNNVVLETLTLRTPSSATQTDYTISLNVLEAADRTGTLFPTTSGVDFVLTVTRPVLYAVGFSAAGFSIKLQAAPGNYVFEASEDLVHWSQAGSVTITAAPVTFTDPNAGATGARFYRVRPE
jgi:hypothetical protein